MTAFNDRLKELMEYKGVKPKELADSLEQSYTSMIYKCLRGEKGVNLKTALKLADYFKCSLDYLLGLIDNERSFTIANEYAPFDEQLKRVLERKNISQYKLQKDGIVSRGNLNNWFHEKNVPNINTLIKLASYLNVSVDYLVGRE